MKYLKMFEAVVGLFPKMIKVTLIDANTGNNLGKYKIPAEQLPSIFNRPISLVIGSANWRVLKADPILANDFLFKKKLTLHVQDAAAGIETQKKRFDLPTICELPKFVTNGLYNDFTLDLLNTDWRQIDLLPISMILEIEKDIKEIETILTNQTDALLGYEQQYIRKSYGFEPPIPFDTFCQLLHDPIYGSIFIHQYGFVKNGFALRSSNCTYYGIVKNNYISSLSLVQFDSIDDEIMRILIEYGLVLCGWCDTKVLSVMSREEDI